MGHVGFQEPEKEAGFSSVMKTSSEAIFEASISGDRQQRGAGPGGKDSSGASTPEENENLGVEKYPISLLNKYQYYTGVIFRG